MKNSIIIFLLVILLGLAGCSSNESKIPESTETNSEAVVEENIEEVNEESESDIGNETPVTQDKPVDSEEQEALMNEPVKSEEANPGNEDSTNAPVNNQSIPAADNAVVEEPIEPAAEPETSENLLKIQGLAENELSLSLEELKAMDDLIFEGDFYWLNSFGTTGYTHFKGINLWNLLELKALIKTEASMVTVIAQDGYKMQFTIEQVKKQDYMDETNPDTKYPMIIAWEENKEEYSTDKGAPFKLVVGQKEAGDVNKPQWVSNIDRIIVE